MTNWRNTMSNSSGMQTPSAPSSAAKELVITVISWLIVVWMCFIFLGSIPYKFSKHPDTQHIFSTIGEWMKGILGNTIGEFFTNFGPYVVGSVELLTSLLLLSPIVYWLKFRNRDTAGVKRFRAKIHSLGGVMASAVMAGAVFFHLFTPLGIEVLHGGEPDGGSLFRAAVSILILGIVLLVMNKSRGFPSKS